MEILLLLLLAIAPGLILVYRYYAKDVYQKEPWAIVWKSFFWGAATVIPAGFLETSIEIPNKDSFWGMVIENFLIVALTEELCKFAVIRGYAYRDRHFDEMMDGIVYGVAVAAGFATFENIFYVLEHGFGVGVVRAILSVPSHIFEGAIIGYSLAKARFQQTSLIFGSIKALLIVVLAHGFFDFILTYRDSHYAYLSIIPVVFLAWLLKVYVKQALIYDAKFIHHLPENDVISPEMNPLVMSRYHRVFYVALRFAAIVCWMTASLFMIGFLVTYFEKGEEWWTLSLPMTPLFVGGWLWIKSNKMKKLRV